MPFDTKENGSGKKFLFRESFADVIANGVASSLDLLLTGAGQTVNQTGGNLVLTSGTTANSETIIRSKQSFQGPMTLRYGIILSQRIANNNFAIELVDSVADSAAFTILSTTSVQVQLTPQQMLPFTAQNIGQGIYLSGLTGTSVAPQRGVIAAVDVVNYTLTLTVAGYPASGSGTMYLYGWNNYQIIYNGTVATNNTFDAQREGWREGASTLSTLTSASPGHSGIVDILDGQTAIFDELVATTTSPSITQRGRKLLYCPDGNVPLYLQIRSQNGTVAPASTTTATIQFVTVEDYAPEQVVIEGVRPMGTSAPLPVALAGVAGGSTAVAVQGQLRGNSNNGGQPLWVATGRSTNASAVVDGRNVDIWADLQGRPVVQLGGPVQLQNMDRVTLSTTTETTLIAAVASVRKGIHFLTIANRDTVAATIDLRDSTAGTIRQTFVVAAGQTLPIEISQGWWPSALNTNWTVTLRVATTTNPVEISAQSYTIAQ